MLNVKVFDVASSTVLGIKGDYHMQVSDLINDVFAATGIVLLAPKGEKGELSKEVPVVMVGSKINAVFLNTRETKM